MDWPLIQTELQFETSRSSGAGGQHVNKTETKVAVTFTPHESAGLTDRERQWLKYHAKRNFTTDGKLRFTVQESRSQVKNKKLAVDKMRRFLLDKVVPIPRKRRAGAFRAGTKKRLQRKKQRGEIKALRGKIDF